jgi:predicted transcriptional regulator
MWKTAECSAYQLVEVAVKKNRHCIYLEPKISERVTALAEKPGTTISNVIGDALRAYFDREGGVALDDRFKTRLDTITAQLNRIERDQRVDLESLALWIRYQLTLSNPIPPGQWAALQALGTERFQKFIEEVGRRIANGKVTGAEIMRTVKKVS